MTLFAFPQFYLLGAHGDLLLCFNLKRYQYVLKANFKLQVTGKLPFTFTFKELG